VGRSEGGAGGAAVAWPGQRARGLRRFELVEALLVLGLRLHAQNEAAAHGNGSGSSGGDSWRAAYKLGPSAAVARRFLATLQAEFGALEAGKEKRRAAAVQAAKTATRVGAVRPSHLRSGSPPHPHPRVAAAAAAAPEAAAAVEGSKKELEATVLFNGCPAGRLSQRLTSPGLADEWRAQVRHRGFRGSMVKTPWIYIKFEVLEIPLACYNM
jgi:hypothetical protein